MTQLVVPHQFLTEGGRAMLPRWLDLYETLTTFAHAFYQKWLNSDLTQEEAQAKDPLWEPHVKIMEVITFVRDTLSVFINAG